MLPLKQAFVHDMKTAPKISHALVIFFAIFQFLFGFNLGFVKQMNNYKTAGRILSVMAGTIMSGIICHSILVNSVWYIIYGVQYVLTFLILMASKYTLYEFLLDLKIVKIELQDNFIAKNIGSIIWIYAFLMFCFKYIIGVIYSWSHEEHGSFIIRILSLIPILGLDGIPIVIYLVYYHIYDKLKHLCLRFNDHNISVTEVQGTYKAVLDLLDKIRHSADNLLVLGFVIDCPKWIQTTWSFLILLKQAWPWTTLGCSYAYALHLTVHMCVPAVCAELMQARADELALLVHERILVETNDARSAQLLQFARYIRARPPMRKAWRLLPPGLQLPIAMLSICTTQLIVIIQFTHLYD